MHILNRTGIVLRVIAKESEVSYPSEANVKITLGPLDFFGLKPITSNLRISPVGVRVSAGESNFYSGPGRLIPMGSYPKMSFSSHFRGNKFDLDGNVANFIFTVKDLGELNVFCHYLDAMFASVFSVAYPVAIEIMEIKGTLGGFEFYIDGNFPTSSGLLITKEDLGMSVFFDESTCQHVTPSIHVIASMRYLQQAERLASEGFHLTTFLAERILNLSKALEAIYGDGVDAMKAELRKQGIAESYIQVFASVRYLRSQADVGHVSFTDLPAGKVLEVHNFAALASSCLRSLIKGLLKDRDTQERLYELRKTDGKSKTKDAVSYLRNYEGFLPPLNGDLTKLNKGPVRR